MGRLSLRKAVRLCYEVAVAIFKALSPEADGPVPKSHTPKKVKRKRLPANKKD